MCYRIEEFSELGEVVPPASVDHLIHTANHMLLIDKPIRHSYGIRRSATQINECRAASLILLRIEFNIDSFLVRLPPQKRRAEGGGTLSCRAVATCVVLIVCRQSHFTTVIEFDYH